MIFDVESNGFASGREKGSTFRSVMQNSSVTAPTSVPDSHAEVLLLDSFRSMPALTTGHAPAAPKRGGWVKSIEQIDGSSKKALNDAFFRITESCDLQVSPVERSNCFDEWKDLLHMTARREEKISLNHRKILGSLLSVTHRKDIADFEEESLKVLQQSTYLLRQPRISRKDSKNAISALLNRKLRISFPLATDGLSPDREDVLDEMMESLINESKTIE